mgnify:CR=1 FL=1
MYVVNYFAVEMAAEVSFCAGLQSPKISEGINPASWMLDVIGAGVGSNKQVDHAQMFVKSQLHDVAGMVVVSGRRVRDCNSFPPALSFCVSKRNR